jgi:Type IV secretion system pilin
MKQKLLSAVIVLALMLVPAGIVVGTAQAACGSATTAKGQVEQGIGQTGSDCTGDPVNNAVAAAVNILSTIVGIAAIIMILVSAFKYITSNGDSAKISSAKTTLIYALVGLAIAGLAETLVHLVLVQSTQATLPTCKSDPSLKPPACR